jgi:hypothetical protein
LRKNPFVWGALCAIFPFILLVLTTQDSSLIHYILNRKQNIVGIVLMALGALSGFYVFQKKGSVTTSFGEVFNFSSAQENLTLAIISGVLFVSGIVLLAVAIQRNKQVT